MSQPHDAGFQAFLDQSIGPTLSKAVEYAGDLLDTLFQKCVAVVAGPLDAASAHMREAVVNGVKSAGESITQGVANITSRGLDLARSPGQEQSRSVDLTNNRAKEVESAAIPSGATAAIAASNINAGDFHASHVEVADLGSFPSTHFGQNQTQAFARSV